MSEYEMARAENRLLKAALSIEDVERAAKALEIACRAAAATGMGVDQAVRYMSGILWRPLNLVWQCDCWWCRLNRWMHRLVGHVEQCS